MPRTHHQRPTPWNRRRALSRAFSLMELVLVMLIAGIIAAIAAPRISTSMGRSRALSAAKRVAADLEAARAAAMANSASRKVVFAPAKASYGTPGAASPLDGGAGTYVVNLRRAPYDSWIPAASFGDSSTLRWVGVYDNDAAQEVVFDGYGKPDSPGWVLVSSGGIYYKVTLDTAGRTSVAMVTRESADQDISVSASAAVGEDN